MPVKEPVTYVNDAGEHITRMPDGTQHFSQHPDHSQFRRKLVERLPSMRERHAALVEEKHKRVRRKKALQAKRGWPADKSAV